MLVYEDFIRNCVQLDRFKPDVETKLFVCEKTGESKYLERNEKYDHTTIEELQHSIVNVPIPFKRSWWELCDPFPLIQVGVLKDMSLSEFEKETKQFGIGENFPPEFIKEDSLFNITLNVCGLYIIDDVLESGEEVKFISGMVDICVRNWWKDSTQINSPNGMRDTSNCIFLPIANDFFECAITKDRNDLVFLGNEVDRLTADEPFNSELNKAFLFALMEKLLDIEDRLYNGSFNETSYKTKIKLKTGKKKSFYKINKVVSIRPKQAKLELSEFASQYTRGPYTHGWWVRGHWRVCKSLGKDRRGEYTQKGRTWVIPHTKNDELGIIDKTRIL